MSTNTPEPTPLIEAPKSKLPLIIGIVVAAAVVIGGLAFFLTRDDSAGGGDLKKVTLGVVGADDPYWKTYQKAAREEGIDLEVKNFGDYNQPNPAVSEGELDLNQFQHIIFLADYNVQNDDDLIALGSTATYPLGLYSSKHKSLDEIGAGDTVIVPDDETNQARGLVLLQKEGLIKLTDGGTPFSTVKQVDPSSKVEVKAVQASITASSLPDVDAAIINNDFVEDAGLKFEDALATDDPSDPKALPYVNIFAARADDADNATYKKLVKIFQSDKDVQRGVDEASGNTAELVKIPVEDLQKSLEDTEKQVRDAR
ncbi:D-methionine transport system substrate-binding protein [Nocardioides albertanoniae]|uniref:D-methionine transport system substrate-binding protein n=1 Tax=Nocardioides albertanoniae TaxID=1175486 RepID=A0A543A7N2_9ACTN|nr:MetQ/NlpA family ABC transporter substrate-binding protein [Nocardioides albertanoniae]TQL68605.1 D-methionine transport system substrate-binding protein [Nocardioides albertanoniae]